MARSAWVGPVLEWEHGQDPFMGMFSWNVELLI
jgi:hypothetical protein